ncbi:hypothetical protein VKA52_07075 [Halobacillus sp. HZG1]|uniref:hypothetical protein n=1 Tax=Halobacillus sp. HZG1 TaxID=3111769 RepID=UPI002DBEB50C|nr:hypothetical protein [Halobacillus sp. HZG1]MEC3883473.1 hypothetical protein [Halobacillus sp. HZG1]
MAKRTYVTMMSLFLILSLSACPSEKGGKIEGNIFEAYEVNQNLQRYAVKTETEQIIKMDEQGNIGLPDGCIPIHSTIEAFHQTIETMGQEKEQYYSRLVHHKSYRGLDG